MRDFASVSRGHCLFYLRYSWLETMQGLSLFAFSGPVIANSTFIIGRLAPALYYTSLDVGGPDGSKNDQCSVSEGSRAIYISLENSSDA